MFSAIFYYILMFWLMFLDFDDSSISVDCGIVSWITTILLFLYDFGIDYWTLDLLAIRYLFRMAHKICCVPGCGKSRSDNVALHMFPDPDNDADRFRTWLYTIGGEILQLDNQKIMKYRKVCDLHFEERYHTRSKRLSTNAVPTLHVPGFSVHRPAKRAIISHSTPKVLSTSTCTSDIKDISRDQNVNDNLIVEAEIQQPVTSAGSRKRKAMIDITNSSCNYPAVQPSTSAATHNTSGIKSDTVPQQPMTSAGHKQKQKLAFFHSSKTSLLTRKIKRLQKANETYSSKLKKALNLSQNSNFQAALKKFSAFALIFTMLQFREIKKKKMGRRFTKKEKIVALALYKQGPKAYRWLRNIFVLPSPLTLSRLLSTAALKAGINESIFENLKMRVKKMKNSDKLCLLMFDEIAIAPHFDYSRRKDEIVGFVNNGENIKTKLADHAIVFMVRGISKNYKQAVAYSFCAGSTDKTELVRQLKEVIRKLTATGLNVLATVCDQGASNKSAVNYLIKETKDKYLRINRDWNKNTFEIDGNEIVPLYDAPHLIKGIRNNLLNKDLIYVKNGEQKTAKWNYLIKLHEENPSFMGLRMLPKLTDQHVLPDKIKKMKVKCATQVFSKSVAVAMGYLAEKGILPEEAKATAEVLIFFDDLFDSVNGSYENSQKRSGKLLLHAVTPNSSHFKVWKEAKSLIKTMKFVTKDGKTSVVPSITNWLNSLENIEYLTNKLFQEHNCRSIWLRHFNQDPLENFFGCVRSHGARNTNPTSAGFENSFAALLVNNLNSVHSAGSNCEKDTCNDSMFHTLSRLFFNNKPTCAPIEIDYNLIMNSDRIILNFKNKIKDIKIKAQISYVTGYVFKKLKKIFRNCNVCNASFFTKNKGNLDYIQMRDYSLENKYLMYPTEEAMECFSKQQDMITYIIRNHVNVSQIKNYMKTILSTVCDYNFIKCVEHRSILIAEMQDLLCRFFLFNWCKDTNKIIKGIRTYYEVNDRVQEMARQYYKKRNKK